MSLQEMHDRTLKWLHDACFFMSELRNSDDEFPCEEKSKRYAGDAATTEHREAA